MPLYVLKLEIIFCRGLKIYILPRTVIIPNSYVILIGKLPFISAFLAGACEIYCCHILLNDLFALSIWICIHCFSLNIGYFPRDTSFIIISCSTVRAEISFILLLPFEFKKCKNSDSRYRPKQSQQNMQQAKQNSKYAKNDPC